MSSFHIQKLSDHLYIGLDAVTDTSLTYNPRDNTFWLQFSASGEEVFTVTLAPEALETLTLKCINRLPELNSPRRVATDAEAIRQPARRLLRYEDRSIQLVLREVDSQTLQAFLWFMKDAELLKRILDNMSRRAAEFLIDDLQLEWAGKDPDDDSRIREIKAGIQAISTVLDICRRLTDEGQLPEIVARPEPLHGEGGLTEAEVDSLLTRKGAEHQEGPQ